MANIELRTGLSKQHEQMYHDLCFVIAFNGDKPPNKLVAKLHNHLESHASTLNMADASKWIRMGKEFAVFPALRLDSKEDGDVRLILNVIRIQQRLHGQDLRF